MNNSIIIKGASEHNLKNINLEIPKKQIVVFTGVSGSGKSSLVFDTICAEAQRQLIETFNTFARRRLPKISKPHVDDIENLSTAMVIDQKRLGTNLRSTVGTVTEIYTNLRMLYSRVGEPFIGWSNSYSFNNPEGMCPVCNGLGKEMDIDLNQIVDWEKSVKDGAIIQPEFKKGGWYWRIMMKCGFFDSDKPVKNFTEEELNNLLYLERSEFENEQQGEKYTQRFEGVITLLKRRYYNQEADSNAYTRFFKYKKCSVCHGTRINQKARSVKVNGVTIPELVFLEMSDLLAFLKTIKDDVAQPLIAKMSSCIQNLIEIGVGYLSLHRPVSTLSGGESQRVKMAKQLDCNLVDLMYILDEPTTGLHARDVNHLIKMLYELRDKGNSVLVVEHDTEVMKSSDYIIDIGPEAGAKGGIIQFAGIFDNLLKTNTLTADYLKHHNSNGFNRRSFNQYFEIRNAAANNLKNVDIQIPKGVFVCITGVAGSGKSSLIHNEFLQRYEDAIVIDQSPVGRSSRSTPMSYIGIFDKIRKLFADATGKPAGMFSFNSNGACPKCKGHGFIKIEMSFLDDVTIVCDECEGKRYIKEVLELKINGKNIFDILELTVNQAVEYFIDKQILRKLHVLQEVGLGYLKMGQPVSTLSGGEAQRIKLASELHKKGNIYIMDEPTTGLHMADIERIMHIINKLVDKGNSVLVIEHNMDVIKQADWIIDIGPEGGKNGGRIVAEGTPEDICKCTDSYTGQYLELCLNKI